MNENLKLNAKLNMGIMKANFWSWLTHMAIKAAEFAQNKSVKVVNNNIGLARQLAENLGSSEIDTLINELKEIEL